MSREFLLPHKWLSGLLPIYILPNAPKVRPYCYGFETLVKSLFFMLANPLTSCHIYLDVWNIHGNN